MDELVQSVVCYNPRPVLLHGYLAPFFIIQAVVYYYFSFGFKSNSEPTVTTETKILDDQNNTSTESAPEGIADRHSFEIAVIAVTISIAAQIITYLFCHWSVDVKCWLSYNRDDDPFRSKYVKVTPTANNGSAELVPLRRETIAKKPTLWFMYQKTKYLYDEKTGSFSPVEFQCDQKISFYRDWKGYSDPEEVQLIDRQYGHNELDMVIPEFKELFIERATAPFFVFQTFCVGLWCLDEFWYYAVFTLFMLVTFEVVLVKHQLRNMQEIRRMGNQPYIVQVYRQNKWKSIRSDQLISGDLVSIVRTEHSVPCDILLLRGSCIVDESTLTGESVPQMKEPIDELDCSEDRQFDINQDKLHILFGGTKVLQHTAPPKEPGCIGYVLRTGFHTSQGKLLRTILFGVKRVTANNFETFCFIMFLLFFALISAYYVWTKGIEDPKRSRYRLFFECTVIITSVVPPELPIELSLAVNQSLLSLSKLFIYCTEPFRIPFAGKVEYLCFDKTGTLTSDDLIVEGVAGVPKNEGVNNEEEEDGDQTDQKTSKSSSGRDINMKSFSLANQEQITPVSKCPSYTQQVLASCHSLAHLDDKLVGDPLEKKILEAVNWNYSKSNMVTPKRGRAAPLKIHQRFHFNSTLKRMSVIASHKLDMSNENVYICTAKGAPEFMRSLFKEVPNNYDDIYLQMSRLGARVLALGYKSIGQLTHQQLSELKREDVEQGLMFAGFILISCPLKPDSKAVASELIESGHRLVMITGDGALTACHVASVLNFIQKEVLILSKSLPARADNRKEVRFDEWTWLSTDQKTSIPFSDTSDSISRFARTYDLCLTGESIDFIMREQKGSNIFEIVRRVKVFARVSPKQKELIITTLKSRGNSVLMCGDGTNDVGALKHAHVGVALLSSSGPVPPVHPSRAPIAGASKPDSVPNKVGQQTDENSPPSYKGNKHSGKVAQLALQGKKASAAGNAQAMSMARNQVPMTPEERRREKMLEAQAKLRQLLEEQDRPQFVKLGDASIAAPFTSRLSSTECISHIIKQGRCTLVTTLQMFKILALNALLSAYCHSVLYLDGIKFNDAQVTIQGLLCTFCFLFITRSQPLKKLSNYRPLPNIFNLYTILTVTLQFAVHFSSLVFLYSQAKLFQEALDLQNGNSTLSEDSTNQQADLASSIANQAQKSITDEPADGMSLLHTEFKPSLVNSTVYIIWMSVQLATFVVNYKGHPFMQDLRSNRPLCYSFIGSGLVVFACVTGWSPSLTEQLSVVDFPLEFRPIVLGTIVADLVLAYSIDRVCEFLFGRLRLEPL